ncbi:unnamed protein product [Schistosoma margrebowiei]|uniref:Uncharacterized protein n=1 Tax=Schistosoma margrebowiei TaxID=48269 RepID=A0A183MMS5_9TREM|nr:unnamed protein product [Schistosoma margrebowiei]
MEGGGSRQETLDQGFVVVLQLDNSTMRTMESLKEEDARPSLDRLGYWTFTRTEEEILEQDNDAALDS